MTPPVHHDRIYRIDSTNRVRRQPCAPVHGRVGTLDFYRNHLLLPIGAALGLSVILMLLHGDFWLADRFYALQGHAWTLKAHPLTESLIHAGGRAASAVAWLLVAAACLWSYFDARLASWRRPLAYLTLTTVLAASLVAGLKSVSGMDCPWDLARYGGDRAFVGLFEARPDTMPTATCFPAGHASAGYAWVTLYFFFLAARPRLRWAALASALAVGATFGFAQQLRGAHFLSHDVWTLMTCWLVALGSYLAFFKHAPGRSTVASTVDRPVPTGAGW